MYALEILHRAPGSMHSAQVVELDWRVLAAMALGALWLLLVFMRRWGAWRRSRIARRRGARALRGEELAEVLLEGLGFAILERQLRKPWTFMCDGEETTFELRADLLVERDGCEYIAEVKTGSKAPELRNSATRRQLLEYALAYESPTILLVDVEREEVHEVMFPIGEYLDARGGNAD